MDKAHAFKVNYLSEWEGVWPETMAITTVFFGITLLFLLYFNNIIPYPYNFYDSKRLVELCVLMCNAVLLIARPSYLEHVLRAFYLFSRKTRWLIIGCFLLGAFSATQALQPMSGLLVFATLLLLFVLGMTALSAVCLATKKMDVLMIHGMVLSALAYGFLYCFINPKFEWMALAQYKNYFPGFVNIRFFAQFQIWTIPILIVALLKAVREREHVLSLCLALLNIFWAYLLFANNSRGELLALMCAGLIVLVVFKRKAMGFLGVVALIFGLALLCYLVVNAHHDGHFWALDAGSAGFFSNGMGKHTAPLSQHLLHGDYLDRLMLWKKAVALFLQHPLLGVGPGHFALSPDPVLPLASPHNVVLQFLSEWGLPATVIVSYLIMRGLRHFILLKDERGDFELHLAICLSVLAGVSYAMVSNVFVTPFSQMLSALVFGWAAGKCLVGSEQSISVSFYSKLIANILLGACVVIFVYGLKTLPTPEDTRAFITKHKQTPLETPSPGYWLQGWLKTD